MDITETTGPGLSTYNDLSAKGVQIDLLLHEYPSPYTYITPHITSVFCESTESDKNLKIDARIDGRSYQ